MGSEILPVIFKIVDSIQSLFELVYAILTYFSVRPISFFSYQPIQIKPDTLNFLIG